MSYRYAHTDTLQLPARLRLVSDEDTQVLERKRAELDYQPEAGFLTDRPISRPVLQAPRQ